MRLLLVNPNRYRSPPVAPLGLEHVAAAVRDAGHDVDVLDLCFVPEPVAVLEQHVSKGVYNVAGITIRNVDTALHPGTEYFLDAIKPLVSVISRAGVPVVLGGSGFSIDPPSILRAAGGDHGVSGPGSAAMVELLAMLERGELPPRVMDAVDFPFVDTVAGPLDPGAWKAYEKNGGVCGFITQVGCTRHCSYCIEACKQWHPRRPGTILAELRGRVDHGITRFHLCDSEFNVHLSHCKEILNAMVASPLDMSWTLYMIPGCADEETFRLLAKSGATLVTLSVASDRREQRLVGYTMDDVAMVARWCEEHGILLAIDLMTGFPGEPLDSIEAAINALATAGARTVGVNASFRLYPGTAITGQVLAFPELHECLTRPLDPGDDLLEPVFYSRLDAGFLKDLVSGKPGFRVEGTGTGVNYQRV